MSQRVRIRDIADELGLSTATVSNVIHGKSQRVSDETVQRVQALLEQRQYIPSMAGILLAQNTSRIIGVFINDHEKYQGHTLEDVFIASSLNHLSNEIEANGLFMMVKKAKQADEILQFASMWNMDGLVIIGFCHQDYMYLRNHIRIPFVIYDGFCENPERIVNITINNFDGGLQMGQYLASLGHRKALCISDNEIGVDKERMDGFDVGFQGSVSRLRIPMHKDARWQFYESRLHEFRCVTAVFAVSDHYAIDLIHFLRDHHFSIPDDLSVAGFDGIPMGQLLCPALTTIQQDGALRAKLAIEKLQLLRAGLPTSTAIALPVSLLPGESTGPIKHFV